MEEINLLQNRVKDTTNTWQRQTKLLVTFLWVVLFLVIGGTAVLFILNRTSSAKIASITADNLDLQQKLANQQKDVGNAKVFQAQLINLTVLLKNHIYLTPLLDELAKYTYQKAQFTAMDVRQTGEIHVEGKVGNYIDLGKLVLGLSTSSKFTSVKLLSVQPSSGKDNAYNFSIDMTVAPDIFAKK